ncbi:MAG TPA: DUF3638 domain-containing protein, partial [Gammaproteobacteria bacterium]|nr:DUF3638 domain-containing protein [Gammaproteobacteria bacterium]
LNLLTDFTEELVENFQNLYEIYDNRRNNIPKKIRLHKSQEKFMLSAASAATAVLNGVVSARYLEQFSSNNVDKSVMYSVSQTLVASQSFRGSYDLLGSNVYECLPLPYTGNWADSVSVVRAFSQLSPWAPAATLMQNLPYYYTWAKDNLNSNNRYQQKIKSFCESTANAFRNKQHSINEQAASFVATLLSGLNSSSPYWDSINVQSQYYSPGAMLFASLQQDLPDQIVMPGLSLVSQLVEHKVANQSAAVRPKVIEEEKPSEAINDFLQGIKDLQQLRDKLECFEAEYQKQLSRVAEKLIQLPNMVLEDQNKLFVKLDTELLQYNKQKIQRQLESYQECGLDKVATLASLVNQRNRFEKTKSSIHDTLQQLLKQRQAQTIVELGRQKTRPTIEILLKGYAKNTEADYLAMGFSVEMMGHLLKTLKDCFAVENVLQRLEKLIKSFEDAVKLDNETAHKHIISALLAKDEARYKYEILFQYIEKIGLYPQQARMLALLAENGATEAVSYVLQLIMGGGKTKVILPLLLYLTADGKKLPFVVVPDATLNTNFCDLRATSAEAFDQGCSLFYFDRDAKDDPASLQHIYENLLINLEHKQYLVTTTSCLQSFQLKFIEILERRNFLSGADLETSLQLYWLSKSLKLLSAGSLIVDEAHLLLHIRKELNYSLGENKRIELNTIETVAQLYSWLNEVSLPLYAEGFAGLLKNPNLVMDEKEIAALMEYYVEQLNVSTTGKIKPWIKALLINPLSISDLQKFILGKATDSEEMRILHCLDGYPRVKEKWLLIREEFSHLLKSTLRNKLHE